MIKQVLFLIFVFAYKSQYFVALETFYANESIPYITALKNRCKGLKKEYMEILKTQSEDSNLNYTTDVAYKPSDPSTFNSTTFKNYVKAFKLFIKLRSDVIQQAYNSIEVTGIVNLKEALDLSYA